MIISSCLLYFLIGVSITRVHTDDVDVATRPVDVAAPERVNTDDDVDVSTRPVDVAATERVNTDDDVDVSTRPAEVVTEKVQSETSAKEEVQTEVGSISETRDEFEELLATLESANRRNRLELGNIDDFYVNPEILKGMIGEMGDKVDPMWYIDSMLQDYDGVLQEMIEDIVKVAREEQIKESEAEKRIIMEDFGIDLDDFDKIFEEMNVENSQKKILGDEELPHIKY